MDTPGPDRQPTLAEEVRSSALLLGLALLVAAVAMALASLAVRLAG